MKILGHNFFAKKWKETGFIIGFNGGDWHHSKEFDFRFEKDSYWGRQLVVCCCFCRKDKYIESFTTFLFNPKQRFVKDDRLISWFPWIGFCSWSQDIDEGRMSCG